MANQKITAGDDILGVQGTGTPATPSVKDRELVYLFRGPWRSTAAYDAGSLVSYNNNFYIVSVKKTASATPPDQDTDWRNITAQGEGGTGTQGPQGERGPQGIQGEQGEQGIQGQRGAVGPQGVQGQRGAVGPQGIQGEKGDQGPQGEKGDTGARGPKGDPGEPGSGGGGGLTEAQVDQRVQAGVEDWAEEGNTDALPTAKIPNIPDSKLSGNAITTNAEIDARVHPFAQADNTDRISKSKLPSDTAYDADLRTDAQVDARADARIESKVLAEARDASTARWSKAKVPSDTVYDADLRTDAQVDARADARIASWARASNTDDIPDTKLSAAAITTNSEIDARIATFARQGATINIPDARLPAVLRGLPSAFGTSGQILQVNADADALEFADAPSGGGGALSVTGDWSTSGGFLTQVFSCPRTSNFSAEGTVTLATLAEAGTYFFIVECYINAFQNSNILSVNSEPRLANATQTQRSGRNVRATLDWSGIGSSRQNSHSRHFFVTTTDTDNRVQIFFQFNFSRDAVAVNNNNTFFGYTKLA